MDRFLFDTIREHRQRELNTARQAAHKTLASEFLRHNITVPAAPPSFIDTPSGPQFQVNLGLATAVTELARAAQLDLPELIELYRHQTPIDY